MTRPPQLSTKRRPRYSWSRLPTWCLLSVGAACASSGGPDAQPAPEQTRNVFTVGSARVEMFNEPGVGARTLAAESSVVWGVLPGVYEHMGIPVTSADPARMTVGNPGYRASRVDGDRMNTFVDCGTNFSGALANLYEVTLTVSTTLTAVATDSTRVLTTVDAYGEPRAVSGNAVHCQSRGVLELRVAQSVAQALGLDPGM